MDDVHAMTLRLPRDVHDWLRDLAHEQRRPITAVVREALEEKRQREPGKATS